MIPENTEYFSFFILEDELIKFLLKSFKKHETSDKNLFVQPLEKYGSFSP